MKIGKPDDVAFGKGHGPLQNGFQLPDIAGPRIPEQSLHSFGGEGLREPGSATGGKSLNVRTPFTQRWNRYGIFP